MRFIQFLVKDFFRGRPLWLSMLGQIELRVFRRVRRRLLGAIRQRALLLQLDRRGIQAIARCRRAIAQTC